MKRGTKPTKLSEKMKKAAKNKPAKKKQYDGDMETTISTGSTLLDLAISGGRKRGGGLPNHILVEIFGPSGSGKTVLLSEIAGAIQRAGGEIVFNDPEARLNKQFASLFDFDVDNITYLQPDTVTELFEQLKDWEPTGKINGIIADSLAALSTNMEMDKKEGDKMGMRRAKEFSEGLRKTCRILKPKNMIMVCSNQVRTNADAGAFTEKYTTPGGVSIGFYSSVRLQVRPVRKIQEETTVAGKKVKRVVGIESNVRVYKNSVWKPYREAPLIILFDYGIDDVQANLQFIKDYTRNTTYTVAGESVGVSMEKAIQTVETDGLESVLREEVIDLWQEIESKFEKERKPKQR